jgi:hypothetical protein
MSTSKLVETSLWANRKCLLICATVAIANMQYGLDSAAIGALQAMPGFLAVFGYPDPSQPGGYGIDVRTLLISFVWPINNGHRAHSKGL